MAASPKSKYRIKRLKVANWRNFTGIDVAFQGRVFLLGPNASGKSNFLDIFRFMHDIVDIGGGFENAVNKRGGVPKIRSLFARKSPDIYLSFVIGVEASDCDWTYEIAFSQDNNRRPVLKLERVLYGEKELVRRPDKKDESDPARLHQTFLEQVNANQDFREIADFLKSVQYLHLVPQLIREPDRSVGKTNDPYGGDFLEQVSQVSEKTRNVRLRIINQALKVAVPQLDNISFERDPKNGKPHLSGLYKHWRPDAGKQNEEQFSDGTLRLIGLLWALLSGSGPLLLEEPELSLHEAIVEKLPQIFGKLQRKNARQIFCSTHSSAMLKDDGIGQDEVLILLTASEGSNIVSISDNPSVSVLVNAGVSISDSVWPLTAPKNPEQLLFAFNGESKHDVKPPG